MVYGLEDEIYLALYTVWQDRADEQYRDWAESNITAMSHLATGIALADENPGFGARQNSSPTRSWRASIRLAPPTTRMVDSIASWVASEH